MQKGQNSLSELVKKMRRLRNRLLTYGWNKQESSHFILYQVLKLPKICWKKPSNTLSFYHIREKYKVGQQHAEIILCLQEIVPDLQEQDVLVYLHSVFDYSALTFGFELLQSSSDSGENPMLIKRAVRGERPLRSRPTVVDSGPIPIKKVHKGDQPYSQKPHDRFQPQKLHLLRPRKPPTQGEFESCQKSLNRQNNK